MTTMSGADALLQQILRNGVDTIFGLPGGQLDHFFDSMFRSGDKVRFVGSRHEQGAAYMAFGYARSTGRAGVYTVVPGPGVLNTTAALCSAYATNSPVLCLTGQIPSVGIGRGIGYLHELPDQLATMRSITTVGRARDASAGCSGRRQRGVFSHAERPPWPSLAGNADGHDGRTRRCGCCSIARRCTPRRNSISIGSTMPQNSWLRRSGR